MDIGTFLSDYARRAALLAFGLACLGASLATAQPPPGEVEKALLRQQHYQDELQLRQRQFAEQIDPTLTHGQRRALEHRHLEQRQRQRDLHDGQARRHEALQQSLPFLPDHGQRAELVRESQQFVRERAEQAEAFRNGDP
ncbi:MAG: hypothetical protein HYZ19_04320 [Rhodocyclales bacterium]|nr:hypothetical protein [Rhodocyclales bacterium]